MVHVEVALLSGRSSGILLLPLVGHKSLLEAWRKRVKTCLPYWEGAQCITAFTISLSASLRTTV